VHIRHTDEDGSSSRHTGSTAKESRDEAADVRARLRRSSVTRASRSLETSMATSRLTCLVTHWLSSATHLREKWWSKMIMILKPAQSGKTDWPSH